MQWPRLARPSRNRFRTGIDLLDLKQVISNNLFSDYGFTKAQWGNANNIYLLSERGYAKEYAAIGIGKKESQKW